MPHVLRCLKVNGALWEMQTATDAFKHGKVPLVGDLRDLHWILGSQCTECTNVCITVPFLWVFQLNVCSESVGFSSSLVMSSCFPSLNFTFGFPVLTQFSQKC